MEKQKSFLALNFYDCMLLKEAGMYLKFIFDAILLRFSIGNKILNLMDTDMTHTKPCQN